MAISLTNAAAGRIQTFLKDDDKCKGVRLGIKPTGCSGYSYIIEFAQEIAENDAVFVDKDIQIIVDTESLKLLDGTILDFVKEGVNEGFQFENPKEKTRCGCGESFTI